MIRTIRHALELYRKSTPFVLASIIYKHGSAPREVGATMIVTKDGLYYGSIGGGRQEFEAIEQAMNLIEKKKSENIFYEVSKEEAAKNGLVCGGQNIVHFQYVNPENPLTLKYFEIMIEKTEKDRSVYLIYNTKYDSGISMEIDGKIYPFTENGEDFKEEDLFKIKIKKPMSIFIFGGGHIAKAVYQIMDFLGLSITVIDDREEFITDEDFPNAIRKVMDYDNLEQLDIKASDYICIMTRGHKYDICVLDAVVKKNPYYIGVVGNKKKAVTYAQHFAGSKYEEIYKKKIHLPVGIEIKALTPEEIAVSIAGEVIKSYRENI